MEKRTLSAELLSKKMKEHCRAFVLHRTQRRSRIQAVQPICLESVETAGLKTKTKDQRRPGSRGHLLYLRPKLKNVITHINATTPRKKDEFIPAG